MAVNITDMMRNDTITPEFFKLSLVSDALTGFLSEKILEADDEEGSNDLKEFFSGKKSGDNDDDQGPSTFQPAQKRPRKRELQDQERPPPKQPHIPSAPPAYSGMSPLYPQLEDPDQEMQQPESPSLIPLSSKETYTDITARATDQDRKSDPKDLSKMLVGSMLRLDIGNAVPKQVLEAIVSNIPNHQIFSVPSFSRIMAMTLLITGRGGKRGDLPPGKVFCPWSGQHVVLTLSALASVC
ncbi:unnamed protein product [Parnassius apollo]|uniref:(apollo) hypothetical protein n=1 Tax=Parnassius apollo TaxID=110799 RepID=A0A8S3Y9K7_PARAO|nr:unnamed protein product [Parnassius apollo]